MNHRSWYTGSGIADPETGEEIMIRYDLCVKCDTKQRKTKISINTPEETKK